MSWLMIAIAILLLLLGLAVFLINRKDKVKADYYALFNLGLIWFIIGIPLNFFFMSALGLVFMVVGLINKNKWKERTKWKDLSDKRKKFKIVFMIVLGLLVILGLILYLLLEKSII